VVEMTLTLNCQLSSMNLTNETLLFVRFLIMYDFVCCLVLSSFCILYCILLYTCANVICIKFLLTYLLTYLLTPVKNGCIDRDTVWVMDSGEPKEACILDGAQIAQEGREESGKGRKQQEKSAVQSLTNLGPRIQFSVARCILLKLSQYHS